MISNVLSRGAASAAAIIHRATTTAAISTRTIPVAASSSITSSLSPPSSALALMRHSSSSSSSPQIDETIEFTQVLRLNTLQQNPGAIKKKRRVGRGIGSSKGKTSGRGHKGQKARAGGSIPLTFEGGQTRFFKLLPKRGFTNKRHKTDMVSLNVGTIQDFIDMGRLPIDTTNETIPVWTMKNLLDAGMFTASSVKHGVKLLAKGKERLKTPFRLEISRASESAIDAVEAVGGEITTFHYNRLALRALLKPHKFIGGTKSDGSIDLDEVLPNRSSSNNNKTPKALPKFARPPPKWQPYYTDWRNRGYLSVQAQMKKLLSDRPELEDKFEKALEEAKNKPKPN